MQTETINPFSYLEKWVYPDSYAGQTWDDYYEVLGQCRDSDILTRSNFQVMLERLGGESETVVVNRCGHWAVGWVESIMIHESDLKALKIANELMKQYKNYPVLDDSHYSDMEYEEYSEYAESEKTHLAEFLEEVFSIPVELRDETENVAYYLGMESQLQGGEGSCFNYNIYHFRKEHDFDTREMESIIDSVDSYHLENNSVFDYLKACLGMI